MFKVFENDRYSAHLLYLRLMLDYTSEWRDIHLFKSGYREDTEGNASEYLRVQLILDQMDLEELRRFIDFFFCVFVSYR